MGLTIADPLLRTGCSSTPKDEISISGYFEKLEFSFKIEACREIYRRHMIAIPRRIFPHNLGVERKRPFSEQPLENSSLHEHPDVFSMALRKCFYYE